MASQPKYTLARINRGEWDRGWEEPPWSNRPILPISLFHPTSSPHRPRTEAKLAYDRTGLSVFFRVEDRFVRAVNTRPQGPVCKDSCVEFFFEPQGRPGYFNLEINCGGIPLMFFVRYPKQPGAASQVTPLTAAQLRRIAIRSALPPFIPIELRRPLTWWIRARIPFSVLEEFLGPLGPLEGQVWRANSYKIASHTSQPHWGYWSKIRGPLSFHQPRYFAPIRFGGKEALT